MSSLPNALCPLCSQVFAKEELYQHIISEHPRLRHGTIQVIQAYHPSWVQEQGACRRCWRNYSNASQQVELMKIDKQLNAIPTSELVKPLSPEPKHVQSGFRDAHR
jgi:hypothetical protein